jgi:thymidine kinase
MFSGKTTELIRHVRTWESAGRSVLACKPHIAHQHNANIESHSGSRIASLDLSALSSLAEALEGASAVAIDEAQFLDPESVDLILGARGEADWALAGLDRDFRGHGFGCIPDLMRKADQVRLTRGRCTRCLTRSATRTQRFRSNGSLAPLTDPLVVLEGNGFYEPRCRRCFQEERGAPSKRLRG